MKDSILFIALSLALIITNMFLSAEKSLPVIIDDTPNFKMNNLSII